MQAVGLEMQAGLFAGSTHEMRVKWRGGDVMVSQSWGVFGSRLQ
jgi:hypothetical protein